MATLGSDSGATFSDDRAHRYRLWREWGDREKRCVFVGINPSTADEHDNDHTIRKCIGFAQRWGFGALDMVNLFAWCDTDQRGLLRAPRPIGPLNNATVAVAFSQASRIVWAWGPGKTPRIGRMVVARVTSPEWRALARQIRCEAGCLGVSDNGSPRHPLMLPYSTPFVTEQQMAAAVLSDAGRGR